MIEKLVSGLKWQKNNCMRVGNEMPLLVGEEGVVAQIKNKRFQLQTMQKHDFRS